ncbi:MAG: insulinase family protein [Clostridiales bacterium]|jgi:predicted Zn-dependent peptidase|nr:insulinase family protein [Clostridiales bacterium]
MNRYETYSRAGIRVTRIPNESCLNPQNSGTDTRTFSAALLILAPGGRQNAAQTAMIPASLMAGCRAYPSETAILRRTEELYGADFAASVIKKGAYNIIQIYAETLDYLTLPKDTLALMAEVSRRPLFSPESFRRAKAALLADISAAENDPRELARQRLFAAMFGDGPHGYPATGAREDAENATPESVREQYARLTRSAPVELMIVGGDGAEQAARNAPEIFGLDAWQREPADPEPAFAPEAFFTPPESPRVITDPTGAAEARLAVGFRADRPFDHYAAALFSACLGGGPKSRLFRRLRGELGLCYFIRADYYRFAGAIVAEASLTPANVRRSAEIILSEVRAIREGGVSEKELRGAKADALRALEGVKYSPPRLCDTLLSDIIAGEPFDPRRIETVTPGDIRRAARAFAPDTIYSLIPF